MEGDPKFDASQQIPNVPYHSFAELIGLKGIYVDRPEAMGAAWDEALAADRPVVLEVKTDPEVPPLPPHITFEAGQASHRGARQGRSARAQHHHRDSETGLGLACSWEMKVSSRTAAAPNQRQCVPPPTASRRIRRKPTAPSPGMRPPWWWSNVEAGGRSGIGLHLCRCRRRSADRRQLLRRRSQDRDSFDIPGAWLAMQRACAISAAPDSPPARSPRSMRRCGILRRVLLDLPLASLLGPVPRPGADLRQRRLHHLHGQAAESDSFRVGSSATAAASSK